MLKLRRVLIVLLPLFLLACASKGGNGGKEAKAEVYAPDDPTTMTSSVTKDGRPAWMPPPLYKMPERARIGIMSVVDNQMLVDDGKDKLYPGFDLTGYSADSLRKALFASTPYAAIILPPSARLMANRAVWQKSWNAKTQTFGDNWQKEFDAIIKQNALAMLVIISEPPVSESKLGGKLQGSGYTMRGSFGKHQTAAFSSIHFFRIQGTPGKLLEPVRADDDPLYSEVANFPKEAPKPLPKPMQDALERELRSLIDKKAARFVTMMK